MGETRDLSPLGEAVKSVCGEYARDVRSSYGFFAAEIDGVVVVGVKGPRRQQDLRDLVEEWGGTIQVPTQAGPEPEDALPQKGTGS